MKKLNNEIKNLYLFFWFQKNEKLKCFNVENNYEVYIF